MAQKQKGMADAMIEAQIDVAVNILRTSPK
jgi:hypothetical protein